MAVFIAFLVFLGYGFDRFYLANATPFPIGSLFALGLGTSSALASYYGGDRAVLLASGAVPLQRAIGTADEQSALRLRQFENVVEEMSIAAGLPPPRMYVIPDPDPNAFATGRSQDHASIAVTQGLLDAVNREELQAVVAHELSHVRNLDIRLMTVIAAMVGTVALIAEWTGRGMYSGRGSSSSSRKSGKGGDGFGVILLVLWVAAVILAPLIGQALAMMVSRRREYLADASAAELTRNPLALARALTKIDAAESPTASIKRGTAHLCIADPLGRSIGLREGRWANLMASHPPMKNRIAALNEMGFQ